MAGFSAATRAIAHAATPTTTPTRDALDAVLARAGSEITLVDPADGTGWLWPDDLAERVTAAAARGCRTTRCSSAGGRRRRRPRQFARLAAEAGTEIRTGSAPDQAMLAVDGVTALLPSDSRTVAVITQPGVVRTLCGFADIAWSHAAAAPSTAPADDAVHRTFAAAHRRSAGRRGQGRDDRPRRSACPCARAAATSPTSCSV